MRQVHALLPEPLHARCHMARHARWYMARHASLLLSAALPAASLLASYSPPGDARTPSSALVGRHAKLIPGRSCRTQTPPASASVASFRPTAACQEVHVATTRTTLEGQSVQCQSRGADVELAPRRRALAA